MMTRISLSVDTRVKSGEQVEHEQLWATDGAFITAHLFTSHNAPNPKYLTHMWKTHNMTASLHYEGRNHKTSLTPPQFITLSIFYCSKRQYQVHPQQARKENFHVHVNLVCVCNNVSIVRTFPTLWYFCFVWRFTILIIRPSREPSWLWSHSSWIYNYLCNQCLLPLKLWVRIASWRGVLDTTLCNKVVQWIVWQVGGFLLFPAPLKLTATIQLKYYWKWR